MEKQNLPINPLIKIPIVRVPLTETEYREGKLTIECGLKIYTFRFLDIIMLKSSRNHIYIYEKGFNETKLLATLIKQKELLLPPHFLTTHDSFIVNMHHQKLYAQKGKGGGMLYLIEDREASVSPSNHDNVLKYIFENAHNTKTLK